MYRLTANRTIVFNAQAANAASSAINMESFRNIELEVCMTAFTGTIKFAGSNADTAPDFSAAATAANPWDYVKTVNQIDGSSVAGGTGLAGTSTSSVTNLETNTNGFKWIAAIVSNYSAGSVTVRAKGYSNI